LRPALVLEPDGLTIRRVFRAETIPWRLVQRVYVGDHTSRLDRWQRFADFLASFTALAPGAPYRGLIVRTERREVVVTALQAATPAWRSELRKADLGRLDDRLQAVNKYMEGPPAQSR
jgi:hypothetical protein